MHPGMLLLFSGYVPEGMSMKTPSITPWLRADLPRDEIGRADIDRYVEDFADAARRARDAGADAVELHASNGCLVSTFLSPITNRRTDEYGGNVENRARFARRIVEGIKEKAGTDFPVIVRLNVSDDMAGGVTPDEVVQQARIMESAGADAIIVEVHPDPDRAQEEDRDQADSDRCLDRTRRPSLCHGTPPREGSVARAPDGAKITRDTGWRRSRR